MKKQMIYILFGVLIITLIWFIGIITPQIIDTMFSVYKNDIYEMEIMTNVYANELNEFNLEDYQYLYDELAKPVFNYEIKDYGSDGTFKSYMDYRKITDDTSKQYELQQNNVTFNDYGIEMLNNRYFIAIGTGHGYFVGDKVEVILEGEKILPCIVGEIKDDKDTDETNIYRTTDKSIIEFIVDETLVPSEVKLYGSFNIINDYNGKLFNIIKAEE